jgi:phosphatidylglycerol:prolipoprotein diacylglycerol transferase
MTSGELWTMAGYVLGALVLWRWSKSRGLDTEGMRWVALAGLGGGVIGARLTQWALGTPLSLILSGAVFDPRTGGKSIVGGLACGYLAVWLAKRKLNIHRSTGDGWALAIPAGEAVGRIGCFLNPCCEGTKWHGAWSVFQDGAYRHPAQLYSSVSALLLFGFLLWLQPKMKREGDLFRAFVVLYGLSRFAVEFFRERSFVWRDLSLVQLLCLEVALSTLVLWAWTRRGAKRVVKV